MTGRKKKLLLLHLSLRYKNIIAPLYFWKKTSLTFLSYDLNIFLLYKNYNRDWAQVQKLRFKNLDSILYTSTPFTPSFLSKHSIIKLITKIGTFPGLAK